MQRAIRLASVYLAVTYLSFTILGCSSGSSGDKEPPIVPSLYGDNISAAQLNLDVARDFISFLFVGSADPTIVASRTTAAQPGESRYRLFSSLRAARDRAQRERDSLKALSHGAIGQPPLAIKHTSTSGGGSKTVTGEFADDGTGTVTTEYHDYTDTDGSVLNGKTIFQVISYDQYHDAITNGIFTYVEFSASNEGFDETLNGSLQISESYENQSTTINANLDGRDNLAATTFRFQNFVTTTSLAPSYGTVAESYAGRVFLSAHGYVDVMTTQPFEFYPYGGSQFAIGGGPMVLSSVGSAARVTPRASEKAQIEIDGDGNGEYEISLGYYWYNLHGDAVALDPGPPTIPPPPADPIVYDGAVGAATITTDNAKRFFDLVWNSPFNFNSVTEPVSSVIDSVSGATSSSTPIAVDSTVTSYNGGTLVVRGTKTAFQNYDVVATFTNYNAYGAIALDGIVNVKSSRTNTTGTRDFEIKVLTFATGYRSDSLSGTIRETSTLSPNSESTTTRNFSARNNLTGETHKFENVTQTSTDSYPSKTGSVSGRVFLADAGYVDLETTAPFSTAYYSFPSYPQSGGPIEIHGAGNTAAQLIPLGGDRARINVDADGNGSFESGAPYLWTDLDGSPAPNLPPLVGGLAITPNPAHASDTLVARFSSLDDPDGDTLIVTYEWTKNGIVLAGQTAQSLSNTQFSKGDVIGVRAFVSDGIATFTALTVDVTILGPLPVVTATPPSSVNHGQPVSFQVDATISDGTPIVLSMLYGPSGMTLSSTGLVTWTPREPMLSRELDVSFGIRAQAGDVYTDYENTITVVDASRGAPFVRTDLRAPVRENGLRLADLDGDGKVELVISDQNKILSTWSYEAASKKYQQTWTYPFDLAPNATIGDIETHDINADGKPEIVVSAGKKIIVIDGATRLPIATLSDDYATHTAIRVADIDNDGKLEVVFLASTGSYPYGTNKILVHDAATLKFKWQSASENYGNSLAIGNVDGDAALEIVAANGFVIDGVTKQTEWNLGSAFGVSVALGDFDSNGIMEIAGLNPSNASVIRVYSGVLKSPIWEVTSTSYSFASFITGNVDSDPADEIVADNGSNIVAYSYDSSQKAAVQDWTVTLNTYVGSGSSLAIGDPDGDGAREVIRAGSYNYESLAVVGVGSGGTVEWINMELNSYGNLTPTFVTGPFTGGQPVRSSSGTTFAVFGARGYFGSTDRLARVNVSTGTFDTLTISAPPYPYSTDNKIDVFDFDNDGIDEIFTASSGFSSSTGSFTQIVAYDATTLAIKWTSANLPSDSVPVAYAHIDLNGDTYLDFVTIDSAGYVYAFDVRSATQLWKSTRLPEGCGADVSVADLDGDGSTEIIAVPCFGYVSTKQSIWIYRPDPTYGYVVREKVEIAANAHVAVGDADHNGTIDLMITEPTYVGSSNVDVVRVLDGKTLTATATYELTGQVSDLLFVNDPNGRAKLLVALSSLTPESPYYSYYADNSEVMLIDAFNGKEIWRTPALLGIVGRHSMWLTDVNSDAIPEITIGTSQAMYVTR